MTRLATVSHILSVRAISSFYLKIELIYRCCIHYFVPRPSPDPIGPWSWSWSWEVWGGRAVDSSVHCTLWPRLSVTNDIAMTAGSQQQLWQIKHHDGQSTREQYITLILPYISRWWEWVWRDWWCCCWSPRSPRSSGGCQDPAGTTPSWTSRPDWSTWVRPWPGWWGAFQATIHLPSIISINIINIITRVNGLHTNINKVFSGHMYKMIPLGNQLNYPAYNLNGISDYQNFGKLPQEPPYYQEWLFFFNILQK